MKYIDMHSHIFPDAIAPKVIHELETYYNFRWKGTATASDLLESFDEAGIYRSVIFSSATKPAQVRAINDYIASVQKEYAPKFIGFGTLHPDYPDCAEDIVRIRQIGLHGLKFHPDFQRFYVDDPRMFKIYEAVGTSMPMLFHIGDWKSDFSSPYRLAHVLRELPGLKIIAAHMGGYSEWKHAWKHLIGRDCLLDISSTIHHIPDAEVVEMVRAHGAERVLFASDYPAVRQIDAIRDVLSLGFTEKELDLIFHRNAETLFADDASLSL